MLLINAHCAAGETWRKLAESNTSPPSGHSALIWTKQGIVAESPILKKPKPIGTSQGFPGDSDGEESACNVGDLDLIPGLARSPGGGHGNALQYSCLENPHGQRSLEGCSP